MAECDEMCGHYATRGDTFLVFISVHMVMQTALVRASDTVTLTGVRKLCLVAYLRKIYSLYFSVEAE